MNPTAQLHAAADAPLTRLLDGVPPSGWSALSPCPGWTAADVVAHLVSAQRDFLGTHGADLGSAPAVAADPAAAWREHAARVAAALADGDLPARSFDGFFGPTTVGEAFARFYVWDMVVHRWDLARAVGADPGLTDAELDLVEAGADGFGPALHMEGICGPALPVPDAADRPTRVLARLGRTG
ncbi:TIGR03086 family metal-binding protein [Modestobacter sp. VKM Ac-2986]|uniref:TIGR03086 family metal-binding protein n=1 Tax=Modestobacter sp. VKM Ac-2986 TaxID=3004140 RepID=UPI0022AA07F2|nr:TIGR03086 family metal-binding protein [Modestobacter sp. VKM Ac-2986]MCZ2828262.1 TIGR03086 family metal-binding protein [Modestobacter sp. VKM Ac-2986]